MDSNSNQISAQPSTSGTKHSQSQKRSLDSGITDKPGMQFKKNAIDHTYAASGVKRALHGTIYQLQLLMLYILSGIEKNIEFFLATEMDAAEKFDDIVLKYKTSSNTDRWMWDFLQAKHKLNPTQDMITPNSLITETDGDFSLQKYFVSFCKIQINKNFQYDELNQFIICTNTDFGFTLNNKRKKDNNLTKKAEEHNELVRKWQGFLEKETNLQSDILLCCEEESGIKFRFKSDDDTRKAIAQEIKSALLKSALKGKLINNFKFVKEKLELIRILECKHTNEQSSNDDKNITKKKVIHIAEEVLKEKENILKLKNFMNLEKAYNELKVSEKPVKNIIKKVLEEKEVILETAKSKLDKYRFANSEENKTLKEDINKLNDIDESLKELNKMINKQQITLEEIQVQIKDKNLENVFQKIMKNKNEILIVKEMLDREINIFFSEIAIIQVALNQKNMEDSIKEFLNKLRFVVKYSNVDKLNNLIKEKIGQDLMLMNADLATHSFQRDMLQWFKSYNNGKATFLSKKTAEEFFESIKKNINILMISGLGKAYPEKLRDYRMHFSENLELEVLVDKFLSNTEKQILCVSTSFTQLSAIRVLQTLDSLKDKYKYLSAHDGYILVRLSTLLRSKIEQRAIEAFKSKQSYNLFVLECNEIKDVDKLYKQLDQILTNSSKKIITINLIGDDLASKFTNQCERINNENSFKDLDSDSQDKVLKTTVKFQGVGTSLNQLIDKNLAGEIIDQTTLLKLLKEQQIMIGDTTAFSFIGYDPTCYINREFYRQTIRAEVLESKNLGLLFITKANEEDRNNLKTKQIHFDLWSPEKTYSKGIVLLGETEINPMEIYNHLCNSKSIQNIHWLEYVDGMLTLRKSKNDQAALKDYEENKICDEEYFCEEFSEHKIVIVANDPGAGKSTVLASVAKCMKQKNSDLWIVRINLNDYAFDKEKLPDSNDPRKYWKTLKDILFDENQIQEAIKFVTEMIFPGDLKDINIQFQRKLFQTGLESHKDKNDQIIKKPKILIFFDGFDEICPSYKSKVTKLLKALKATDLIQFWITTRVHEKNHLENKLNSLAYILSTFTETDQINYLNKIWIWNLKQHIVTVEKLAQNNEIGKICESLEQLKENIQKEHIIQDINEINKILANPNKQEQVIQKLKSLKQIIDELDFTDDATELIKKWNNLLKDTKNEFTNVPLQLKMLAEVLFEKKFQIPKNLCDLYKNFIQVKFEIYYREKAKATQGNESMNTILEDFLNKLKKIHCILASIVFIPDIEQLNKFKKYIKNEKKTEEDLARIGLLTLNTGQLEFTHRSFSEYFFSQYLIKKLKKENIQDFFLNKILLQDNYELVCVFVNGQLELKGFEEMSDVMLTETVKEIINDKLEDLSYRTTILRKMCRQDHTAIFKFLIYKLREYPDTLEKFLLTKDRYCFGPFYDIAFNRMRNISNKCRINIIKTLLEPLDGQFNILKKIITADQEDLDVLIVRNRTSITILEKAIITDYYDLFDILLEKVKIDKETFKTILSTHNQYAKVLILHFWIQYGINELFLNSICSADSNQMVKETVEEVVLESDNKKNTILHAAVTSRNKETINILLKWILDNFPRATFEKLVLEINLSGKTPLHMAVEKGKNYFLTTLLNNVKVNLEKKVFQELLLAGDNDGNTVLHLAAIKENQAGQNPDNIFILHALFDTVTDDNLKLLLQKLNKTNKIALYLVDLEDHEMFFNLLREQYEKNGIQIIKKSPEILYLPAPRCN